MRSPAPALALATALVLAPILALSAAGLRAQAFYIPNNTPATGTCNVVPFGSNPGNRTFANQRYQTLILAAELGNTARMISSLGFAACATGVRRFDRITIRMDHFQGVVLGTTFAANLSPNAITVLDVTDHDWHHGADRWADVGLRTFFPFDGTRNLVVDITVRGAGFRGISAGFRSTLLRQRLIAIGWTQAPPATGVLGPGALKMEVLFGIAKTGRYGHGCVGRNGLVPNLGFRGAPRPGQTLNVDLADAPPQRPVALIAGTVVTGRFPIDLTIIGAPGCIMYHDSLAVGNGLSDLGGKARVALPIANIASLRYLTLYFQWACLDPGANSLNATTSQYGKAVLGN